MLSNTAESILCLVTSRGHAATIIGDLVETSGPHGRIHFWRGVIQTACALLWREIADQPRATLFTALRGLAQLYFLNLVVGWVVLEAWIWIASGVFPASALDQLEFCGRLCVVLAAFTLWPYHVGAVTARSSDKKDLAGAVYVVGFIFCICAVAEGLTALLVHRPGGLWPGRELGLLRTVSESAFILAGAMRTRMSALKTC